MPRRKLIPKSSFRNLKQYKHLSDDEFDELFEEVKKTEGRDIEFEKRIQEKLTEFDNDYDISDLRINDKQTLRALAQAVITLEDLEQELYHLQRDGVDENVLVQIEKFSRIMSTLRTDISKMQDDLKISRKVRKNDSAENARDELQRLKDKAQEFYEQKMQYVFCPKCKMLLATTWYLYPDRNNKLNLTCGRKQPDGTLCGHNFTVSSRDFIKKGRNIDGVPKF